MKVFFLCLCNLLVVFVVCFGSEKTTHANFLVNQVISIKEIVIEQDTTVLKKINTVELRDTLSIKDTIDSTVQVLSIEERIQLQRLGGMYKVADYTPAVHFDLRKPNYVIIHHTSQHSMAQTLRTFQLPHTKVSSHYVIGKDGQVVQLLNDYERAWHAGKSKWGSLTDLNSTSIGIELDNNGRDSFPDVQINSLLILLDTLKSKYLIPDLNFIGHADIAPTRKNDPNVHFPWKKLAERGFGVWYNEDYQMEPPVNFNPIDALKIMGYDMRNPEAAIEAFKRKFIVKEVNKVLTDHDIKVLYDLYRKYY